jgi:peptide/nickel transport system permease protein
MINSMLLSNTKIKKEKKKSYYSDTIKRFRRHKLAMVGLIILILEILLVFLLPVVLDLEPNAITDGRVFSPPSAEHILGTDQTARDNFSRLIYGGQTSLLIGILSSIISLAIGMPLGLLAGYYRGPCEHVVMRLSEVFMSFPSMVIILVIVSLFNATITNITFVIGILGWPQFARLLYANVLSYKEKEYVEGARAIGTRNFGIMVKYILPNAFSPLLVAFTFRTASAIIMESSLSYLGMGVKAPQASWGNILNMAQSITVLAEYPYVWLPPGILLVLTVLSINFFGDGLRDALDPKMKV